MPRPPFAVRRLVQIPVIALASTLSLTMTGCGAGEPRSIGPAGVDGLEIPTATPEPDDFSRRIDNPWFPLPAGGRWTYRVDSGRQVVVAVTGREQEIAEIMTTEVATTTTTSGRGGDVVTVAYYAQDRDGNVWSFGGDDWQAGVAGAQAGLVMPATPRVGDGFVQEYAAGLAEDRSEVLDVAASVSSPYGSWTDAVEIRESTPLEPTIETVSYFAPDVGRVRTEKDTSLVELVSFTQSG